MSTPIDKTKKDNSFLVSQENSKDTASSNSQSHNLSSANEEIDSSDTQNNDHIHPDLLANLQAATQFTELQENDSDKQKNLEKDEKESTTSLNASPSFLSSIEEDTEEDEEDEEYDDEEDEEDEDGDRPMTLRDHLRELRKRLFKVFLWIIFGFICMYPFGQDLYDILMAPLHAAMPKGSTLIYTVAYEAFFSYMKTAFVVGIFLTSPVIFYQIWSFIAPGLYKEEKQHILPVSFFSAFFFILGGLFCYFIVFPHVFEFFMSYSNEYTRAMPGVSASLSMVLQMLVAFGIIFELPLFTFILSRLGLITADWMRRMRRYSILLNFIIAAILTPPDVISQLLMVVPLLLLYEFSIIIAVFFGKKEKPSSDEESEDDENEDLTSDNK